MSRKSRVGKTNAPHRRRDRGWCRRGGTAARWVRARFPRLTPWAIVFRPGGPKENSPRREPWETGPHPPRRGPPSPVPVFGSCPPSPYCPSSGVGRLFSLLATSYSPLPLFGERAGVWGAAIHPWLEFTPTKSVAVGYCLPLLRSCFVGFCGTGVLARVAVKNTARPALNEANGMAVPPGMFDVRIHR